MQYKRVGTGGKSEIWHVNEDGLYVKVTAHQSVKKFTKYNFYNLCSRSYTSSAWNNKLSEVGFILNQCKFSYIQ